MSESSSCTVISHLKVRIVIFNFLIRLESLNRKQQKRTIDALIPKLDKLKWSSFIAFDHNCIRFEPMKEIYIFQISSSCDRI